MEQKKITCTECPKGCLLCIDIEDGKVVSIKGNTCPKGDAFGREEIESPKRFIASTVFARGLELRMVPVRTDKPVPREKMSEVMAIIHLHTQRVPVKCGDVIVHDLLDLDIDLIATRDVNTCG